MSPAPFDEPGQHPLPYHLHPPTSAGVNAAVEVRGSGAPPVPPVPSAHNGFDEYESGGMPGIGHEPTLPPFSALGPSEHMQMVSHTHAGYEMAHLPPNQHHPLQPSPHLQDYDYQARLQQQHQYQHPAGPPVYPTQGTSLSPHAHHSHLAAPLPMPGHEQMHMHPRPAMHTASPPFRHVFARLAPPGQIALDSSHTSTRPPAPASAPTSSESATIVPRNTAPRAASAKVNNASPLKKASSVASSSSSAIDARAQISAQAQGKTQSEAEAQSQSQNPAQGADDGPPDGLADPKKRASKACETCRVRRTKCVGGRPCDPCKALGVADDCIVRVKARPNRCVLRYHLLHSRKASK